MSYNSLHSSLTIAPSDLTGFVAVEHLQTRRYQLGLFAVKLIPAGELLGLARWEAWTGTGVTCHYLRSATGAMVNHSPTPNAELQGGKAFDDVKCLDLVASEDIRVGEQVTICYTLSLHSDLIG